MTAITKQLERLAETSVDDEIVVMRLDNGDFFSLAGTAAAIWRLVDDICDRDSLIAALAAKYGADEREIAADVDDFLAQLKEQGLVTVG